jgi:hypothetical protein
MRLAEDVARVDHEIIARGREVYDQTLKEVLEPRECGRFVAIEPASGRYFLGNTGSEALVAAHRAMPESQFFLKRVGSDITYRLGGYANR